jgi:hypothetical protein
VWKLIIKKKRLGKVSSRLLRRQIKNTQLIKPYSESIEQAIPAEKEAIRDLRKSKLKATKWQKIHNRTLESALAKANRTTVQAERRNLNQIKTQSRQSHQKRCMNGKFQSSGLSKIEKNFQEDGVVITHTSKQGIEIACANQNINKYSQTEDTPPMTEPLLSNIGYLAETPEAQQILDGTYDPPNNLDPYAKKLLEELQMPKAVKTNRISTDISTDFQLPIPKMRDKFNDCLSSSN